MSPRRRDVVPVLGLRTIGRHPAAANLPLLVLLLTAAFGAFSSVVASSVDEGQVVASYLEVGADYRVERRRAARSTRPSIPGPSGVEAVAPASVDNAPLTTAPRTRASFHLERSTRAYDAVTAGTPARSPLAKSFLAAPTGNGVGTDENPIPAILSRAAARYPTLAPGDMFQLTVVGQAMTFRVEQRRQLRRDRRARVLRGRALQLGRGGVRGTLLLPSVNLMRGPARFAGAGAAAATKGATVVVSRYDSYAALHDAPLGAVVATGYRLALVVAAIYMALTIIGVSSSAPPAREVAFLRTLGCRAQVGAHDRGARTAGRAGARPRGGARDRRGDPRAGPGARHVRRDRPTFLQVDWPSLAAVVAVIVWWSPCGRGRHLALARRTWPTLRIGDD